MMCVLVPNQKADTEDWCQLLHRYCTTGQYCRCFTNRRKNCPRGYQFKVKAQ